MLSCSDCTDKISALTTTLARLTLLHEIFGEIGEKISYYVISDFKTLESLLKELGKYPKYSEKRTTSPSITSRLTETI